MKKTNTAKEIDDSIEHMEKLFDCLNEVKSTIEGEHRKIERTILKLKANPKPDIEMMTLPERLRCYKDGLKYSLDIIKKYIQLESVSKYGDIGKD